MRRLTLLLLMTISFTAVALSQTGSPAFKGLLGRLEGGGKFSILIGLLRTADKENSTFSALLMKGPHTILAPNDAAFAKLPKGMLEELRKNKPMLHEFLLAHVFSGRVMVADMLVPVKVSPGKTLLGLTTLNGNVVNILCNLHTGDHHPTVNGITQIGRGDLLFSGGVIHEVDSVLKLHPGGAN
jgi:uncharacterized surface protein with fasciclin (FAS1) repeats